MRLVFNILAEYVFGIASLRSVGCLSRITRPDEETQGEHRPDSNQPAMSPAARALRRLLRI